MALLDSTYNAGDTAKFTIPAYDYDGSLFSGLEGTIDIFYGGSKIVAAQAVIADSVNTGWYYYNYQCDNVGLYEFNITLSNGTVGSGIIEVGSGDAAKESTSQAILADTNELQGNQNNWLTATGFSTFDATTDEVITDSISREASKADLTGIALSSEIADLNNLSAQQVWEYVTRTLTSAGSGGATAQEVWEYATRSLTQEIEATIDQDAFNDLMAGYFDSLPGGDVPGLIEPPPSTSLVKIYMYCKDNDDTPKSEITPVVKIPKEYIINHQAYSVNPSKHTYNIKTGLFEILVPEYCPVDIRIPETRTSESGFVGVGGTIIAVDELYSESQAS